MSHDSVLTFAAFIIATLIGIVSGLENVAFKRGTTDAKFGELCLRKHAAAVWVVADKKNFSGDQIWTCNNAGCFINQRSPIKDLYKNPPGGDAILLELIPDVNEIHANKYTCQTQHWSDDGEEFVYDVTVYDDKLSCSDNVTQHRAGDTIQLDCGITAWGKGKADLEFQILSAASVIESRVDHERKSNTQITSKLLLDKSHHEKRIDCVLKGFDSAAATSQVDPCTVNGQKLNILYSPELTKKLPDFRFAKEGDEQALDCSADANPAAQLEYIENNISRVAGNAVRLTQNTKTLTCKATNSLGSKEHTMKVNFLQFDPTFSKEMKEGVSYKVLCGLQQSNELIEARVRAEMFIGEEKITSEDVKATRSWNGQKMKCLAKKTDVSRSDTVLLEIDIATLNVLYDARVSCSDQSVTTDYFERVCSLEENPLSPKNLVKVDPDTEIEWGEGGPYRHNFTLKMKRTTLAEKEDKKQVVSISIRETVIKNIEFNYTNPKTAEITVIVGLVVGLVILAIVIALLIIFLRRIGVCSRKKGLTDSEKGDSNFPSDDGHGQPPANRSMNGYDNKIAPNDDGLVYADLAFSDHQPRSRAPIIDPYSTTDYADIDFGPHPPPYSISDSVG